MEKQIFLPPLTSDNLNLFEIKLNLIHRGGLGLKLGLGLGLELGLGLGLGFGLSFKVWLVILRQFKNSVRHAYMHD